MITALRGSHAVHSVLQPAVDDKVNHAVLHVALAAQITDYKMSVLRKLSRATSRLGRARIQVYDHHLLLISLTKLRFKILYTTLLCLRRSRATLRHDRSLCLNIRLHVYLRT